MKIRMNRFSLRLAILIAAFVQVWIPLGTTAEFDLVIANGRIVDGSGAPWFTADIGVTKGKIAFIGPLDEATTKERIDASGLVVMPGLVDMMGQSATSMIEKPETALNLLTQGITTINCGEGGSAAPLSVSEGTQRGYTSMLEYLALLEMKGLPLNVVQTVGHTQVRRLVLGDVDRRPSDGELEQMKAIVREAMEAGAIGVSTALIYPPAVYAPMEEIAALSEVAGEYGGSYYTHMRNEGDQLLEAIEEALAIGRRGKVPVHIFHLKAAGKQNWGKMPLAIARIKAARSEGQEVTADIYPYINNGLGIAAFIHPRHFAGGYEQLIARLEDKTFRAEIREEMTSTGGWENWYRHVGFDWNKVIIGQASSRAYRDHVGKSLAEIAQAKGEDPWDTFFNLVATGAFALPESMTDANKILAMQQEFVSFCTDVGPAGKDSSSSHPRAYGAFPRLLSRYVRNLGAISLERAVAQASAVACNDIHVFDRGRISEGLAADIVMLDYESLTDQATFSDPTAISKGVEHVVVAGKLVLRDGELTSARPGRVLRGPGYRAKRMPSHLHDSASTPTLKSYDAMAADFLSRHRAPGLSVAVTDGSRLVHASGYGLADLASHEQVTPKSLFRIASISKPITAVAILQLVERGQLALDAKVLEILDLETAIEEAGEEFDRRWNDITIRWLLQHRGGWDRSVSFDAMFQPVRFANLVDVAPPAGKNDVIVAMLRQSLDYVPGERYAYSNFGYNLLGRVIEKLTGMDYERYVQKHVLLPLGIRDMRIGRTRLSMRAPEEVKYYQPGNTKSVFEADLDKTVPYQYGGWHLEAMDSHGGWLATAVDLARFASAFDTPDQCPILSKEMIELMYQRPAGAAGHNEDGSEKDTFYSLGWLNRVAGNGRYNHWHTGSLSGTATIMIRRHDRKNFVALLNSRVSPSATHLGRDIDQKLHQAAADVNEWPKMDLFSKFLAE